MEKELLKDLIPPTISLIVTGAISILIGVLLERFRNRITILKKIINNQPVAFTTRDDFWGHIKVIYNKEYEARSLFLSTIELINNSNRDIEDLELEISTDPMSWILSQSAFYKENNKNILLTENFQRFQDDVDSRNSKDLEARKLNRDFQENHKLQRDLDFVLRNKFFEIPILNRKTSILVNLLTDNREGISPIVEPIIQKTGIKIIDFKDESINAKRTQNIGTVIGLILVFIFLISIIMLIPNVNDTVVIWTGVFCTLSPLFGVLLLQLFRTVKNLLFE